MDLYGVPPDGSEAWHATPRRSAPIDSWWHHALAVALVPNLVNMGVHGLRLVGKEPEDAGRRVVTHHLEALEEQGNVGVALGGSEAVEQDGLSTSETEGGAE